MPGEARSDTLAEPDGRAGRFVGGGGSWGRRLGGIAVVTLLLALGSRQITRAATVWVWPSAAPCDTTLQACLDNTSSGDEVLIAQSGLINEQDKIIDKSLTLEPEPGHGYTPQIEQMIVRTDTSATSPVGVLVSHVQVATTLFVQLESASASGSTMTLDHSPPRARAPTPGSTGSSPMVPRSTSSSHR